MEIVKGSDFAIAEPTVVTIGNFDGLHTGHMRLIRHASATGKELAVKTAVLTFDPHPASVLSGKNDFQLLTTSAEKAFLLERIGVDYLVEYPFTLEFSNLAPEAFVKEVLIGKMNTRALAVGDEFRFSKGSSGSVETLKALSSQYGFALAHITPESHNGAKISSSGIKKDIALGNISAAALHMGRPYFLIGSAEKTSSGFCVIPPENKLLPPPGKYRTTATFDGTRLDCVSYIKKTPQTGAFLVETILNDYTELPDNNTLLIEFL